MPATVTVVGSLNHDRVLGTPRLPGRGETVIATTSTSGSGGKGANQAAAAGGLSSGVSMVGRVSDDVTGEEMIDDLRGRGVDVRHVIPTSGVASGVATVVVEDGSGENLIVVEPGANGRLEPGDVVGEIVRTASVVLLQLEVPMPTVIAAARAATGLVVLNPAPTAPLPPELVELVDVLVPNEGELERLTDTPPDVAASPDSITRRARSFGKDVVVTLGARGALVVPAEGPVQLVEPPLVDTVDTTGAGDCFCGALSVALSEGRSLIDATRFATAAAALSTTGRGARGGLPDRAAVDSLLASS